jgi:hypothetical protein
MDPNVSTAKDIAGKIFERIAGEPLPVNPNPDQRAKIADVITGAKASDVIGAVVDHLGLSTELAATAEAYIADRLQSLAQRVDSALNETEAAFLRREAQCFLYLHTLLARASA